MKSQSSQTNVMRSEISHLKSIMLHLVAIQIYDYM